VLIATPVSAIACNVVRLIPTVWLYGNYPSDVATLVHDIGGWVMLVMSFLILLGIVRLIRWAKLPVTTYTLAYD
jgi:exosortase/archaeosortase family protein